LNAEVWNVSWNFHRGKGLELRIQRLVIMDRGVGGNANEPPPWILNEWRHLNSEFMKKLWTLKLRRRHHEQRIFQSHFDHWLKPKQPVQFSSECWKQTSQR
jgi:hypothetical protein